LAVLHYRDSHARHFHILHGLANESIEAREVGLLGSRQSGTQKKRRGNEGKSSFAEKGRHELEHSANSLDKHTRHLGSFHA
jgi:hypothetical protein